jgi:hypothetical protein
MQVTYAAPVSAPGSAYQGKDRPMPRYSEQRDVRAEVQAQAVDLVDRLGPLLATLSEVPRTGAWSELARATQHLQEWYQLAFVSLAGHPEPGRTQEGADAIATMLDQAAHHEEIRARDNRPLSFDEKASCAAHAATVAEHLRQCLLALGQRIPGAADDGSSSMSEDTADEELQRDLDRAQHTYQQLARATLDVQQ